MKLPNWFKISYWATLVVIISYFFIYKEFEQIKSGNFVYLFIFLIWIAILLIPLFSEIKFFGIELKKEISELKDQVSNLHLEIRNKNIQETNINLSPSPPSDKWIEQNQKEIKKILEDSLKISGAQKTKIEDINSPDKVSFLFNVRYNIEKEIRRINKIYFTEDRKLPLMRILADLKLNNYINNQLYATIRDVYSITSPAIHGEENYVTNKQLDYIKSVVPELIATLKEIK